jgi:hypothetical protein
LDAVRRTFELVMKGTQIGSFKDLHSRAQSASERVVINFKKVMGTANVPHSFSNTETFQSANEKTTWRRRKHQLAKKGEIKKISYFFSYFESKSRSKKIGS